MQISWLGYGAFRIQHEGTILITDPSDSEIKFKINKQAANIIVASHGGDEHAAAVSGNTFLINEPGEYEVQSFFVHGVPSGDSVLYMITIDSVSIAFLGKLKKADLTDEHLGVLEGANILIVPVGGGDVCDAKQAVQIINQVEPSIVIPSYHKIPGSKKLESVSVFLKEYAAPHEETDKLKIFKKDLPEDTKVVVLKH